ncbi:MAG: c-type cytochrome domain-containing protein [Planctomycetota bacterium]
MVKVSRESAVEFTGGAEAQRREEASPTRFVTSRITNPSHVTPSELRVSASPVFRVAGLPIIAITWAIVLLVFVCTANASESAGVKVGANPSAVAFFESKVRPILTTACLECHGELKQKSKLRLDSLEAMLKGGKSLGPALIPGDPSTSPLMRAVRWEGDEDFHMPPNKHLTTAQIGDLAHWVSIGAPWPDGTVTAVLSPPSAGPPLVGRIHPIVVHLPIACLLLAALSELLALRRGAIWRPTTALLVLIGTLGSAVAIVSGLQLASDQSADLLDRHELLGWLTLTGALIASALLIIERWVPMRRWLLLAVLIGTAILVAATGHIGGQMAWGRDWLPF